MKVKTFTIGHDQSLDGYKKLLGSISLTKISKKLKYRANPKCQQQAIDSF